MDSKVVQKEQKKIIKSTGCRNIHFSVHSPNLKLEYCKNCDGMVQVIEKNFCACCKKKVAKLLTYSWLTRVLKFGVKQHHNFINDWLRYPDFCEVRPLKKPYVWYQDVYEDKPPYNPVLDHKTGKQKQRKILVKEGFVKRPKNSQILEVRYRDTVYSIPVKYLALALEPNDADVLDDNGKVVIEGGEEAKLKMIKKHVGIKGLRIYYPEEEQMDIKCKICCEFLKFDKDDNIFCPICDKDNKKFR